MHVVHQLQDKLSNFVYEPSFEVDNVIGKLKPLLLLCSGTHEHMLKLEPLLISSIKKHALKSGVDFIVSRTKIRTTNKYVTLFMCIQVHMIQVNWCLLTSSVQKNRIAKKRSCECAARESNSLKSRGLGKMSILSLKRSANAPRIRRERQEPNIIQRAKPRFP